jgi:hypothetical protein
MNSSESQLPRLGEGGVAATSRKMLRSVLRGADGAVRSSNPPSALRAAFPFKRRGSFRPSLRSFCEVNFDLHECHAFRNNDQ